MSWVESRRSLSVKADDPKKDESGRSGARYTIELDISKNVIHLKKWKTLHMAPIDLSYEYESPVFTIIMILE